jgi:hypothetical protein
LRKVQRNGCPRHAAQFDDANEAFQLSQIHVVLL